MSGLYEKSLIKLELDHVLEMLAECAGSEDGKRSCLTIRPRSELDEAQALLEQTTAAADLCTRKGTPGFSGVCDVSAALERADIGGCLQPKELLRRLVNVHIAPSPLCRAAYTEKALKAAVLTGTKQYVMLGAGMDTFAFRETEFLSKYRVFEVDHPLTQADKLERIARTGWTVPDNLIFVSTDFTSDSLA